MLKTIRRAATLTLGIAALSCSGDGPSGPITIDPPTNVTVTLVSPTSARITWTASTQADKVVNYNVFRNGAKLSEILATSYLDTGLVQLTQYSYAISANGPAGVTSALSTTSPSATITPPDVTPPTVTGITPANGATGIASSAVIDATFSESIDQATINATNFVVKTSGGTTIPGALTYTATTRVAEFKPTANFASSGGVSVSISGVKDVAGNTMAAAFTSTFTVRDEIAPTVVAASPTSGATNVATNTPIVITFSEKMTPASINSGTFTLVPQGQAAVTGVITYDSTTLKATLTPAAALLNSTTYTINATTGATDVSGNALVVFSSTFTTAAPPDITPPGVASVSPSNGATDVAVTVNPTITFNRAMSAASLNSSTITLTPSGGSAASTSISYNATTNAVTITPSAALAQNTTYTIGVTTGALGSNNIALQTAFSSTFKTVVPVTPPDTTHTPPSDTTHTPPQDTTHTPPDTTHTGDTTPPTVVSADPANGATNVAIDIPLSVVFSEAMDSSTFTNANMSVKVTSTSANVPGFIAYFASLKKAAFFPQNPLANSTGYTLTVTTGVKDVAGNRLASPATISITTAPPPDVTPPGVLAVTPADGSTNVSINTAVTVTFNRAMNASTINSSTITLAPSGGAPVAASVAFNAGASIATLTPSAALANSTTYKVTVTTGVQGSNNAPLPAQFVSAFTTAGAPVVLTPIVLDFCAGNIPPFFAFKNGDDAWVRVLPDGNGSFSFSAAPKVAITFVQSIETDTYYTTAQELQAISGVTCVEQGSKTLNFSVTGTDISVISAGGVRVIDTQTNIAPDGTLDLLAMSYNGDLAPLKAIVRRNLMLVSGATVPVFDFSSGEAFTLGTNQLSVNGLLGGEVSNLIVDFATANRTHQNWLEGIGYAGATHSFKTVPSSFISDGDLHSINYVANGSNFSTQHGELQYFRQPSDRFITLGPRLTTPTFSVAASAPYLLLRGVLPSQAEYGKAVQFYYSQSTESDGERDWVVTGTAGYFGGTAPSNWDLTMPDMSGVAGFPSAMGFQRGFSTSTFALAWSDLISLYIGRAPRDGDSVKNAGASSPDIPPSP